MDKLECEVCGKRAKIKHKQTFGKYTYDMGLCKSCNDDFNIGLLTKGDLHIAHYAKLRG